MERRHRGALGIGRTYKQCARTKEENIQRIRNRLKSHRHEDAPPGQRGTISTCTAEKASRGVGGEGKDIKPVPCAKRVMTRGGGSTA